MKNKKRVVITGMGVSTSFGFEVDNFFHSLVNGKSAIKIISLFDISSFPVKIGGEINRKSLQKEINILNLNKYFIPQTSDFVKFALVASEKAYTQSKLNFNNININRCGIHIGTSGDPSFLENLIEVYLAMGKSFDLIKFGERGIKKLNPFVAEKCPQSVSNYIAKRFKICGPASSISTACASSTQAIGRAYQMIKNGETDLMITGGTDAMLDPIILACFYLLGTLSLKNEAPEKASRPFDAKRDGFVLSEGAGIIILEELEHAKKRNAPILGELIGYGSSMNAYAITDFPANGQGVIQSMERAINDANINLNDIDYINAHGTSTVSNDRGETNAIKQVFGELAYTIPINSTKSMLGHTISASGVLELIATIQTLRNKVIHPTINYDNKDLKCDLNYVPNKAISKDVKIAMSNSFGFGGNNGSIIVKEYN